MQFPFINMTVGGAKGRATDTHMGWEKHRVLALLNSKQPNGVPRGGADLWLYLPLQDVGHALVVRVHQQGEFLIGLDCKAEILCALTYLTPWGIPLSRRA